MEETKQRDTGNTDKVNFYSLTQRNMKNNQDRDVSKGKKAKYEAC